MEQKEDMQGPDDDDEPERAHVDDGHLVDERFAGIHNMPHVVLAELAIRIDLVYGERREGEDESACSEIVDSVGEAVFRLPAFVCNVNIEETP